MSSCPFGTMDWYCALPSGHAGPHSSAPLSADPAALHREAFEHYVDFVENDTSMHTDPEYRARRDAASAALARVVADARQEVAALRAEVERLRRDRDAYRDENAMRRGEGAALRAEIERLREALADMLDLYPDAETLDALDDDLKSGKRRFPGDAATIRALKAWHALAVPTGADATSGGG